ncbi:antirestriction protein ArdA [Streptococcus suis]|uniref:antirestriction protein ArdA n=1 Tax=Streptococcus suis TaxID=1307 RepID=UPI0024107EB4|nr:antirestriction protein ArdA [Streptococcus suis]MDG3136921.1 antirestriction protein ArdA [Streptococcus suis]
MELICTFRDVKRGTTVTVACPISYEELKSRMGLDEGQDLEYIVVDSTENLVREYDSLDLINEFVEMIEDVDDDLVLAVREVLGYHAKEIVREGQDYLESCTLLPEVDSKRDLGHYYVDEVGISNLSKDTLESYFDYEAYGRDIDIINQGGFSSYGYLQAQ